MRRVTGFFVYFDVSTQCSGEYGRLLHRLSETGYAIRHQHFTGNVGYGGRAHGNFVYAVCYYLPHRAEVAFWRRVLPNKCHFV